MKRPWLASLILALSVAGLLGSFAAIWHYNGFWAALGVFGVLALVCVAIVEGV